MRTYLLATIFLVACSDIHLPSSQDAPVNGGHDPLFCPTARAPAAAPAAPLPSDCGQDGPLGTSDQLTIEPGAYSGPRIDPPEYCHCDGDGFSSGAYIRVHGSGTRRLVMAAEGLERGACQEPPPSNAPEDVCPVVTADAIFNAVFARLTSEGVPANGIGLGVCGRPEGFDLDAWKDSVGVNDWKFADAAVRAVDEELKRWGAGGSLGVSVRGIDCIELD
jgi:hypothetical protein